MTHRSLGRTGLAVALLALAVPPSGSARGDDLKDMQGIWKVVSAQVGNQTATDAQAARMEVRIDGNKLTLVERGQEVANVHFDLDPSSSPGQVDFFKALGKKKEKLWLGIYQFDGQDLKFCWGPAGQNRPTEFAVKPDTEQRFYVLRKR